MQAIDWADAPFQYISFRMWDQAASYYRLDRRDPERWAGHMP